MADMHDVLSDDQLIEALAERLDVDGAEPVVGELVELAVFVDSAPLPPLDADFDASVVITDARERRYAVRSLVVAAALVVGVSSSGVSAAVTGDPLFPAREILQRIAELDDQLQEEMDGPLGQEEVSQSPRSDTELESPHASGDNSLDGRFARYDALGSRDDNEKPTGRGTRSSAASQDLNEDGDSGDAVSSSESDSSDETDNPSSSERDSEDESSSSGDDDGDSDSSSSDDDSDSSDSDGDQDSDSDGDEDSDSDQSGEGEGKEDGKDDGEDPSAPGDGSGSSGEDEDPSPGDDDSTDPDDDEGDEADQGDEDEDGSSDADEDEDEDDESSDDSGDDDSEEASSTA